MRKITPLILVMFLLSAGTANAANLYIDSEKATFSKDDTFRVQVRIDTDTGECINAAEVVLNYPEEVMEAIDVSKGESIFTLWVEEPQINKDEGRISFAGGIPGGYCGRIAGDPGLTNVIATLIFQPKINDTESVTVPVEFNENQTSVLLNDGRGTEAPLDVYGAEFTIDSSSIEGSGEWFDFLARDETNPEPFTIELSKNNKTFDGKYYIAFSTTDKESGVDHYEILEQKMDDNFLAKLSWFTRNEESWRNASSPYVLKDQTLNSVISVKAIDKAGNERIATLVPPKSLRKSNTISNILVMSAVLALVFAFVAYIKRRFVKK